MDTLGALDRTLTALGLTNDDLVRASREQLTFKQVQKARKGKPITPNIQGKILRALKACVPEGHEGPELGSGRAESGA
ncbi:MAG: hypothetical protein GX606_06425 [Elusimicrobia bacterium]|nr:hypothetical protein [Elusimicrobiota bacterium]